MRYFLYKIMVVFLVFSLLTAASSERKGQFSIALLKYNGGGDWYANPTSLPNLVKFCNENIGTAINSEIATVTAETDEIFNYPFVHITGHGNIVFSNQEVQNLRNYLMSGGFLHISDNYGMDEFIRREMKRIFPENEFVELPASHPIYQKPYSFPQGLPKIHEHDAKRAQGFGIIFEGRLVCFYDYECDLGDGWEDPEVHNDPQRKRTEALRMGANLISYAFLGLEPKQKNP
ncbi:MAG: DUF4159 domain-containing protein [Bacteroidales bacterium]|nr:DUF4159 domain-containing protein [Bacteroidales bacterium]